MKWEYNQTDEVGISGAFDFGCCVVATPYRCGVCFPLERRGISSESVIALSGNPDMRACRIRTFRGEALSMAPGSNAFPAAILNAGPVVRSVGNLVARYGLAMVIGWIGVCKFYPYEAHGSCRSKLAVRSVAYGCDSFQQFTFRPRRISGPVGER
jgi:hypothetical protein